MALVTLGHDNGTAAILRDADGSVWLTGSVEHGGGTGITDAHGAIEGLGDDRMVQGGLLPDGAVRVEIVDAAGHRLEAAVGNGAWVAVLEGAMHEPAPLAGWGGSEVRPTSMAVMHGDGDGAPPWARVALDTGDRCWEGHDAAARNAFSNLLCEDEWPLERSRPALTVWLKHREREAVRIVSRAVASTIQIGIDGIDHPATVVHHDPYLAAVIDAPPGRITISAHGLTARDLGLVRLEHPEDLVPLRLTPRPPF